MCQRLPPRVDQALFIADIVVRARTSIDVAGQAVVDPKVL